jgi:hypothetical protein
MSEFEMDIVEKVQKMKGIEEDLDSITVTIYEEADSKHWGYFGAIVEFVKGWPLEVEGRYSFEELDLTSVRLVG